MGKITKGLVGKQLDERMDNWIMERICPFARRMDLCDWDSAMDIPLSAMGKTIYWVLFFHPFGEDENHINSLN